MKRIAFVASLFVFAACAPKAEEAPAADAMAAPAADMMMDSTKMDSTKMDSSAMAAPMADSAAMKKH